MQYEPDPSGSWTTPRELWHEFPLNIPLSVHSESKPLAAFMEGQLIPPDLTLLSFQMPLSIPYSLPFRNKNLFYVLLPGIMSLLFNRYHAKYFILIISPNPLSSLQGSEYLSITDE